MTPEKRATHRAYMQVYYWTHEEYRNESVARARAWREANRERERERKRLYNETHRAETAAVCKAYRTLHKLELSTKAKARRVAHPELERQRYARMKADSARYVAKLAQGKVWKDAHPERAKAAVSAWKQANYQRYRMSHILSGQKRRARLADAFVEAVDPVSIYKRDKGKCGICHKRVSPTAASFDHILPIARGGEHSSRNIQIAHLACNVSKGARATIPQQLRII